MLEKSAGLRAVFENHELLTMFERVAKKNGYSAETVLSTFIKDYIVSNGHPGLVSGSFLSKGKNGQVLPPKSEET